MCGIAGLFDRSGRADLGRLHTMGQLLRHRGPDDEGFVLIDPVLGQSATHGGADTPAEVFRSGLAWAPARMRGDQSAAEYRLALLNRRLAIVDLEPTGHQPICDPEGRDWIVYNGEVYNHVELRAELEGLGHRFVGRSDTEVLLAAYRQWGADFLHRLNGMFAIAIWDGQRRQLFLARDRFGVKPLYFQYDGRRFAFASEPKALVLTQAHRVSAHLSAVRDLLALDWVDHTTHTFFEGLSQLAPGHWMTVSDEGMRIGSWWEIDDHAFSDATAEELAREFAELFTDGVRLRLRADVEVGTCLSGGLDSTAVLTTAARQTNRALHAFTCAYEEGPAYDERPWVQQAVAASGAISHVVVPDGGDFWPVFDRMAFHQDEPTAGPGVYSQWKVMELASETGLKVLLDGQGGDEVLAGYHRYLPTRLRDLVALGDWAGFASLWGRVADRLGTATTLLHTFEPWLPAALVAQLRGRAGQGKHRVLSRALARETSQAVAPRPSHRSHLWRHLEFDVRHRQLPSLLRYEDRSSMAFGIETRLPFLDYRLVEFAFALPDQERLDHMTTKAIARRALADRVPQGIRERRDKMGFETPTDLWLRGRHAAEVRRRLERSGPFQDWVEPSVLAESLDDHLAGRREIGLQLWRWLSLEAWAQRFLARDPRVMSKAPETILHAGQHRSFVEATAAVEADTRAGVLAG